MKEQTHTYEEIMNQVESWKVVYNDIVDGNIITNINIFSDKYDEIIFFGCGSSYNLSQSVSFFTKSMLQGQNCLALPSSEILINSDVYINQDKKYLFIGFSRSGETTESINVVKLLQKQKNVTTFTFSCKEDNVISKFSDYHFLCRKINEKSIVMTVSFSSMLIAYCLMLCKFLSKKKILSEFKDLISSLNKNIHVLYTTIESYLNNNSFNSYFVLGSGFNYGLALEADLKMKEMSQVSSYSCHLHELNHGPKSTITRDSLCLILTLNKRLFKKEEIIKEILSLGAKVTVVGGKDNMKINSNNISYFLPDLSFNSDIVNSFLNIPVFHILAYIKTVRENLNPDKPKNLAYAIKI